MTSKKKVRFALAKLALLIAFLVYSDFFGQLGASHGNERTAETKAELKILERKMEIAMQEKASVETMQKLAQQYKEKIDPGTEARKVFVAWIKARGISGLITKAMQLYLYLLPWFAGLFLIWFIEGSDKNKKLFKNPWSLIISIIFYPFVAAYVANIWLGSLERDNSDAVMRAKRIFFALLSDDDIEKIKRLARDYLLKIFRETRNTQPSSRIYLHCICRYLDGFIREIDHIPDALAFVWLTHWNYQSK